MTSVASLSRIITPVDLDVAPFTGEAGAVDYDAPIEARFRIQTYVLPGPDHVPDNAESEEAEVPTE